MSDAANTDKRLIDRIRAEADLGTPPAELLRIIRRMVAQDPSLIEAEIAAIANDASMPKRRVRH